MSKGGQIKYFSRIADKTLERKLGIFPAINIVGPKFCGKTTTALCKAKSAILLQEKSNK